MRRAADGGRIVYVFTHTSTLSQSDEVDFCSQSDGVDFGSESAGVDFASEFLVDLCINRSLFPVLQTDFWFSVSAACLDPHRWSGLPLLSGPRHEPREDQEC